MKMLRTNLLLLVILSAGALTSCVPLALGAAGGYLLGRDGVRVQSPITTEPKQEEYRYEGY